MSIVRLILCVLFVLPKRISLLFFLHNFGKIKKCLLNDISKKRERQKKTKVRRAFYCVLLIQLSSILFAHLAHYGKSEVFPTLFTIYFDFYEFYSSLSLDFEWKWFNLKLILNLFVMLCIKDDKFG